MKKWVKCLAVSMMSLGLASLTACSGSSTIGSNKPTTSPAASTSKSSSSSSTGGIQERTLKVGIELAENHPQGKGMRKFADLVKEKSGGKIKMEIYYNSQLGDAKKMIDQLQAGLQDVGIIDPTNFSGEIKEYGIFGFPFAFNNEKEADAVLDGPFGQKMLEKLPAKNLIGLSYWENGFRNITNSKHPINTAEDLKGLKIRTMQNKVHIDSFAAIGMNPTPMAFSELFTALESKTVDGQENPLLTIQQQKFNEIQKYLTITNHVYTPFIHLISKKTWDKLSDEEKKIFKDASVEASKYNREVSREDNKKTLDDLKASGMQVTELSTEEKAKISEKIKPVIDKYTKELGPDLVQQMYDEIKKARGN